MKRLLLLILILPLLTVAGMTLLPTDARADEPFIGEVRMFAGNFAPRSYAFCNGQLLQIAQNTALFSILGTTYGGDGRTTFGLPDLRGRTPIGAGRGPGLTDRRAGQRVGQETVALTEGAIASHNHPMIATTVSCKLLRIPPSFPFLGPPMAGMAAPPSAYRTSVGARQSGRDEGRGLRIVELDREWDRKQWR